MPYAVSFSCCAAVWRLCRGLYFALISPKNLTLNFMKSLKEQVKEHAIKSPTEECCGLVLQSGEELHAFPCKNTSSDPTKFFRIDPEIYLKHFNAGTVRGYFHSHINNKAEFSEADKAAAEASLLPLYLYVIGTDDFLCYTPTGKESPLEGRAFVPEVHDCWAIIHDYYKQVLGVTLPLFPRTSGEKVWAASIPTYLEELGIIRVTVPQKHDIIVMCVSSSIPNHAAIYLGDGHMLHQRANDYSRRDVYGGFWKRSTVMILRFTDLEKLK
jgi:proteasome lid subunit RPN8/RPN11